MDGSLPAYSTFEPDRGHCSERLNPMRPVTDIHPVMFGATDAACGGDCGLCHTAADGATIAASWVQDYPAVTVKERAVGLGFIPFPRSIHIDGYDDHSSAMTLIANALQWTIDRCTVDTDSDGVTDSFEQALGTDDLVADTDGDGLSDYIEAAAGLNPTRRDTDADGWDDGFEWETEGLEPTERDDGLDRDGDGLDTEQELRCGTSPVNADTDGDGVSDSDEDADNDGLSNAQERHTDPLSADTDGDGLLDGEERLTDPRWWDTDGDGRSDSEDTCPVWGDGDQRDICAEDSDGDGRPDCASQLVDVTPLSVPAAPCASVAVVGLGVAEHARFRAILIDDDLFTAVAFFDRHVTFASLAAFDSILVTTNSGSTASLGDALADYAGDGGGIVTAMFWGRDDAQRGRFTDSRYGAITEYDSGLNGHRGSWLTSNQAEIHGDSDQIGRAHV